MIKLSYIKTRAPFLVESHYFNINKFLWEDYWRKYNDLEQFIIFYGFGKVQYSKIISEQQFIKGRFFYQDWLMDKYGEHLNG